MRRFITFILVLSSFSAWASDYPRHMVQVTTQGLGVGAAYEKTDPRSESQFDEFDIFKGRFILNYAYSLSPEWQLGGLVSNRSEERDYETKAGQTGEVTLNELILGIFAQWNFADEMKNAWYTGFMFSYLNHEDETKNKAVFNYLEDDKNAETYEVYLGKRFALEKWGLSNITYSPSLSIAKQRARKDYEDDGLQDNMSVNLQLIKFDVLF